MHWMTFQVKHLPTFISIIYINVMIHLPLPLFAFTITTNLPNACNVLGGVFDCFQKKQNTIGDSKKWMMFWELFFL